MADTINFAKARKLTLHLGVIDNPYRTPGKKTRAITTFDVAQILENKYGLFSVFYRVKQNHIARDLENSLGGALESLMKGQVTDPWGAAEHAIDQRFRDFLSSKEAENVGIPGTPTKAALRGVNYRLEHPYAKSNPRRPSFIDTGMLMRSFKSRVST